MSIQLKVLPWNNKIGLCPYFVSLCAMVMIDRDSLGYLYSIVRDEIIGYMNNEQMQKNIQGCFH